MIFSRDARDRISFWAIIIPIVFRRIWYEFVNEEMWHAVKAFKNPTIDFKKLNRQVILQIKKAMPELF